MEENQDEIISSTSTTSDLNQSSKSPLNEEPTARRHCCYFPFWCRLYFRRLLIFTAILVLALVITAPVTSKVPEATVPSLEYTQNSQVDYPDKIIIIGAGAAGLYAGYTLKYLGVQNFEILEASNVVGGRIAELDNFIDVPLDLGAEWIHVDPKILNDLLLPFDNDITADLTLPETIDYRPQTYATEYGPCCDWIRFYRREYKFRNTTWWGYFNSFIVPHIVDHIRLETVVTTIDWSSGTEIEILTQNGTRFVANQVILAVPGIILQNQDIEFVPPLPEKKQAALDKIWFAPGLKVWIEFKERFYPDVVIPGSLLDGARYDKLYFNAVFGKPTERNVLCLFEVADTAPDHIHLSDEEIVKSILKELDEIFDGQATENYVQHHVQNWSKKPYIQSAYSYNYNDFWEDISLLQESVEKRLYFSGEHLYKDDISISTVHGAALTGRRSAQQIFRDHHEHK